MSQMNRRQLLRNALLGSLGYGAMASLNKYGTIAGINGWYEKFRAANPWAEGLDAITVLTDALQGGPSLLFVSQAMAQGSANLAFLDIFMSTSADIRNYLNLSSFGNDNDPLRTLGGLQSNSWVSSNITKTDTRFGEAKVNQFFTELILTGRYRMGDGQPMTLPGFESLVSPVGSPIDPSKISFASFVSYVGTGIHQDGATGQGSIAHLIQANAQLSPIGVSAFGRTSVIGSSGATLATGRTSSNFVGILDALIAESYVDKDGKGKQNRSNVFDSLNGNAQAAAMRKQWLANLEEIRKEVQELKTGYGELGKGLFNALGETHVDGAASIAIAAKLASAKLGTVSTVGLDTFDFHAPEANKAPTYTMRNGEVDPRVNDKGNMITATIEAGIGLNVWAKALIDKKMDGVAFIRTCSGRDEDWVEDRSTVSSVAVFVKGSGGGPVQTIANAYYGPERANSFVENQTMDWAGGVLGMDAGAKTAGIIDGTIAEFVVNAAGKSMEISPAARLGKLKKTG